jgi:hypothetical protein
MKSARFSLWFVYTILILCFATLNIFAQSPTGTIVGTITDSTGAALPNANVTIRDISTGTTRTTVSSQAGAYEFATLHPSIYEISVEATGFKKAVQGNVTLAVGDVIRADIKMQVGATQEIVEVKGEAPLLEPDKNSVSYGVAPIQIQTLPMLNRNFINLALTTPGSLPQAAGTQAGGFSVSGMRAQSNNFTLDGVNNNDPQVNGPLNTFNMADAVQEFNVQTSIAGSEVGRNSGAQVSIITKSGTNAYHGSLFYLGRNEALDANDFFLNRTGQPKNMLRRHHMGGTMSGPIKANKTFWFASFEAVKLKNPLPQTARVPSDAERLTVTDPISQKLLAFIPHANTPLANGINWSGVVPQTNNNETYFLRVDHNLSDNQRLMARGTVFLGRTNTLQQNPFNGNITNWPSSHSYVVSHTFNTNRMVNEARLAFSRNHTFFQAADHLVNPASIFTDAAGNPLPGYVNGTVDALDSGLPRITVSGFSNFGLGAGTNMPQGRATNTYELSDDVTWTRGDHTFRFGGEVRREITNRFLNGNFRGAISFSSTKVGTTTFSGFDVFARGLPRTGSLRTGGPDQTFRNWFKTMYYLYAQDTWKARSNLTLTYGLRYELPSAFDEIHNRGSNFVPGIGMVALGSNQLITIDPTKQGRAAIVLVPTTVNLPRNGQFSTPNTNFGPYLGITYSPRFWPAVFGNDRTVIRTGFRMSYDEVFNNIPVNMGLNGPQLLSTTLPSAKYTCTGSPCAPATLNGSYTWASALNQNRFLFNADPTVPVDSTGAHERGLVTFNAVDPRPNSAYGMNYALEIERQIGSKVVAGVSYVGSQGRHLGIFLDQNEPFVVPGGPDPTVHGDSAPNLRFFPFQQYGSISSGAYAGSSNYNAVTFTYKQRPILGMDLAAFYTFGKSLDFNSSFFGSDRDFGSPADPRNLRAEYGRSDFDLRHRFVVSYGYGLPFGHGHQILADASSVVNQIVGNWHFSGIISSRSGFPFTVWNDLNNTDFSGFNEFADRGTFATGPQALILNMSDPAHAFNPSAFLPPTLPAGATPGSVPIAPGASNIGNTRRNAFDGPRQTNWDFSVQKAFPWSETQRFQIRADFFNFLNHAQFNLPVSTLSSSAVGTITSDSNANPRIVQLGLRYEF